MSASGLPVNVIAERTGLTRQYIYSMMKGTCNPAIDKVEKLFDATGNDFSKWIDDRSMYGRDKRIHDQIQMLLNQKGLNAATLRNTVEALLAYSADKVQD